MLNNKDVVYIANCIAGCLEGKGKSSLARLLHSLARRTPVNRVNYWVFKKARLTGAYSCLAYTYQKSSTDIFTVNQPKEQEWGSAQSGIHCMTCLKTIQKLMHSDASYYEVHEHSDGLQAVKVDLSDQATGSRVIYSFHFLAPEQEIKPACKSVIRCLLPVFFHTARQISYDDSKQEPLSKRETVVLEWVKQGKSTWDISQVLSIIERTVNFHVKNIYQKLGVVSRAQAVAVAIDRGLIESSVLREGTICID